MADELKRRLVHASGTLVPLIAVVDPSRWELVQGVLVAGAVAAIVLEIVRLYVGLDWVVYDRLTREYEQDNLAGYALALISMGVVAVAFDQSVAIPAILMLTIGDPISGLLGSGELRTAKQAYVLLTMFGVCLLIAAGLGVPTVPAVLGALAATAADGLKPVVAGYVVDDNLTIPLAAAVAIAAGIRYLPSVA
ncbi:Dolichol kinase [Halomicrobium zhouii]|uniref:Dolichol kinase n=1 Tax=Halomicrobium zhouii TaxID=767519 RepID=A0A1I6K5K6_9EURY|nr:dolichol kinase [Halomicrobium zhouii]SFR86120.1 Dolichol kinase [Halomicrobium zhouii]